MEQVAEPTSSHEYSNHSKPSKKRKLRSKTTPSEDSHSSNSSNSSSNSNSNSNSIYYSAIWNKRRKALENQENFFLHHVLAEQNNFIFRDTYNTKPNINTKSNSSRSSGSSSLEKPEIAKSLDTMYKQFSETQQTSLQKQSLFPKYAVKQVPNTTFKPISFTPYYREQASFFPTFQSHQHQSSHLFHPTTSQPPPLQETSNSRVPLYFRNSQPLSNILQSNPTKTILSRISVNPAEKAKSNHQQKSSEDSHSSEEPTHFFQKHNKPSVSNPNVLFGFNTMQSQVQNLNLLATQKSVSPDEKIPKWKTFRTEMENSLHYGIWFYFGMGSNIHGQLLFPQKTFFKTPVLIPQYLYKSIAKPCGKLEKINANQNFTAFLKDGQVYLCGSSRNGKYKSVGFGIEFEGNQFVKLSQTNFNNKPVVDFHTDGSDFGCYMLFQNSDGDIFGCGKADNFSDFMEDKQLEFSVGDSDKDRYTIVPNIVPVNWNGFNFKVNKFHTGGDITMYILQNGEFYYGGNNHKNGFEHYSVQQIMPVTLDEIKKISLGYSSIFILDNYGRVHVRGVNVNGAFGLGDRVPINESVMDKFITYPSELFGGEKVIDISVKCAGVSFLTQSGTVYVSGSNNLGCLGLGLPHSNFEHGGINELRQIPQESFENKKIIKLYTGHSMKRFFIAKDQSIYAAGNNCYGSLGVGLMSAELDVPYRISNLFDFNYFNTLCNISMPYEVAHISPGLYHAIITVKAKDFSLAFRNNLQIMLKYEVFSDCEFIFEEPKPSNFAEINFTNYLQPKTT